MDLMEDVAPARTEGPFTIYGTTLLAMPDTACIHQAEDVLVVTVLYHILPATFYANSLEPNSQIIVTTPHSNADMLVSSDSKGRAYFNGVPATQVLASNG
jgi:hypothetical protein